jgi:hypothetical protein
MIAIPDFHDGFFDGLWTSGKKVVHVFLRTRNGERSTIILKEVERLSTSDFMAGNIILDVVLVEAGKLTIAHIEKLYWPQPAEADAGAARRLLRSAQENGFWVFEINPSYGAEYTALFKAAEIKPSHVLPQLTRHLAT